MGCLHGLSPLLPIRRRRHRPHYRLRRPKKPPHPPPPPAPPPASPTASPAGKTAPIPTAAGKAAPSAATKPASTNPPTASWPSRSGGVQRSSASRPYPRNTDYCEDRKKDNQSPKTLLVMPGPSSNVRDGSTIAGVLAASCGDHRVDACS